MLRSFRAYLLLLGLLGTGLAGLRLPGSGPLAACAAEAVQPDPSGLRIGATLLRGGYWFQYLGPGEAGGALWLYPHLDGVCEIFQAQADPQKTWSGDLESRFDPVSGRFENIFNAAEVLNEFIQFGADPGQRQARAQLLRFFISQHRSEQTPYYLRRHEAELNRNLTPSGMQWLDKAGARRKQVLARVEEPGTRVVEQARPVGLSESAAEYYRRLFEDGYLDVAVVGGNLYYDRDATYTSWVFLERLRASVTREAGQRFEDLAFRSAVDRPLSTALIRIKDRPIRVRMHFTGGSGQPARITRGVANFVEGLANADLFIYHGHSNHDSGSYYAAEQMTEFTRFQIGMGSQRDLIEKCYGLKSKSYQILAFQSCAGYRKYAHPVAAFFDRELSAAPGATGFIGPGAICYCDDLAPRFSTLLRMLLEGQPPKQILLGLNAIKPRQWSPNMVFRGVLQPRWTFIVPPQVRIEASRELEAPRHHLIEGRGSDGRTYLGTGVFAQDRLGEVVQVAALPDRFFGLFADGTLYEVGPGTDTSMVRSPLSGAQTGAGVGKIQFIGTLQEPGRGSPRLVLIGADGRIWLRDPSTGQGYAAPYPHPPETQLLALGSTPQGEVVGKGQDGRWYRWERPQRKFLVSGQPPVDWSATPSLLGRGLEGTLWCPELQENP